MLNTSFVSLKWLIACKLAFNEYFLVSQFLIYLCQVSCSARSLKEEEIGILRSLGEEEVGRKWVIVALQEEFDSEQMRRIYLDDHYNLFS